MLEQIPRPLLVFGVLLAGVLLFFLIQEPQSRCDSQLTIFKESQEGFLFPKPTKGGQRPASHARQVEACKVGNSPGACYEVFTSLKKLVRDLSGSPQECLVPLGQVSEVSKALKSGTQLLVQLAWGDRPPDTGLARVGWLEAPDLALYCQLKSMLLKIDGEEAWEKFRASVQAKLPGEAPVIEDGVCLNCDFIKKASETLSPEEIWSRSLFSLRCENYL
jgi:hypothetical protein